jgi:hypothetical protein
MIEKIEKELEIWNRRVAWCSGKDEGKEKNLVLHRKWRKKKVTMLILYTV